MDDLADTRGRLRSAGLRVTRPRAAVLDAVGSHPHSPTDSIIQTVREELPAVSHQAVYDALNRLTAVGLLRRIEPAGSVALYETRIGDNHHHAICRACGGVSDINCVVGEAPCLTSEDTDGFVTDTAEIVFWGTCRDCAASDYPSPSSITASPKGYS